MKRISVITCILLIGFMMAGCTDLKEEILNEKDSSDIISDSKNAPMLVAPAYAYLRDLQSRSGVWLVLESVTDEMLFPTRGTGTMPTTALCSHTNMTVKIPILKMPGTVL